QRHRDRVAVSGERLVHRVVDDLVDEVVQASRTRGSDVHAGALAHRLETLENLNGIGAVLAFNLAGATGCLVDTDFGLVLRGLAGHRGVAPSRLDRLCQSTWWHREKRRGRPVSARKDLRMGRIPSQPYVSRGPRP